MGEEEGALGYVVATYREIAEHFGLKGPDQARTKAKRAQWEAEPQNHPADTLRIRVPGPTWNGKSQARERGLSGNSRPACEIPSQPAGELHLTKALEAALEMVRERTVEAERARAEAIEQRERAGAAEVKQARAEGERDAERETRKRAEGERDAARGELGGWTAGGPIARAVRALLHRR